MPRPNRNMKRVSFFAPTQHDDIIKQLADRKGLNASDIYRAMLKTFLKLEVEKLQEKPKTCEHGQGLTDYCQPCGRIHGDS